MKKTLQRIFGQGIFYTGWKNAIFSLLLAVGVYFTSQISDLPIYFPHRKIFQMFFFIHLRF